MPATNLDGQPIGEVDLTRSVSGPAIVKGQLVVATRRIGGRMALILGSRQYCVSFTDYWHALGMVSSAMLPSGRRYGSA